MSQFTKQVPRIWRFCESSLRSLVFLIAAVTAARAVSAAAGAAAAGAAALFMRGAPCEHQQHGHDKQYYYIQQLHAITLITL